MRGLLLLPLALGCSTAPTATADAASDAASDAAADHPHDLSVEVATFDGPTTLEGTGLYTDASKTALADGVIPYTVRYELWSDGDTKKRYFRLPPGTQIDTSNPDHWRFPVGTKAWKEFATGGTVVETRLQEKLAEGSWRMVAYAWAADGSTKAVPAGVPSARGTSHDIPFDEACHQCHDGVRDGLIGVSLYQLSRVKLGAATESPLKDLASRGLLSVPMTEVDPPGAGDVPNVLGYLHGNCGHCHNDVGIWSKVTDLRLRLRAIDKVAEETWFYTTTIGKAAHHAGLGGTDLLIVKGDPDKSQLYYRTGVRDFNQMPPVATKQVDEVAHGQIKSWIAAMK